MHPQLWDTPAAESLRFQQVVALAADSWQNSEAPPAWPKCDRRVFVFGRLVHDDVV